jgi:hypothetical protein
MNLYTAGRLLVSRENRTWHRVGMTLDKQLYVVRKDKDPDALYFVDAVTLDSNPDPFGEVTCRCQDPERTPRGRKRKIRMNLLALFERVKFNPFRWEDAGLAIRQTAGVIMTVRYVTAEVRELVRNIHAIFGETPFTHGDLCTVGLAKSHWTGKKLHEARLVDMVEQARENVGRCAYVWKLSKKGIQVAEGKR